MKREGDRSNPVAKKRFEDEQLWARQNKSRKRLMTLLYKLGIKAAEKHKPMVVFWA